MSIYMDRHDVSDVVTAENVAQLHQEDLKIQHKFCCKGLTYWFDDERKTAFCLVEAPNKQAVIDMHNSAHGEVPHQIIEVDANLVESFLGRIEDPKTSKNIKTNIIMDPAFRTIMIIDLKLVSIEKEGLYKGITEIITKAIPDFSGSIVKQYQDYYLISFDSVSKAVLCSLEVKSKINNLDMSSENTNLKFKICLSAGVPVTEKASIFEDAIKLAERMCNITQTDIVVSSDVKELYKSENANNFIADELVYALTPSDEQFLNHLLDYTEEFWKKTDLTVDDFSKHLGYSKSQLYRKMVSLTNKSPNTFLKEYRLNKALGLLNRKKGNVSEIAFEAGFNSLSYFSKCFQKRYKLLPSDYLSSNFT